MELFWINGIASILILVSILILKTSFKFWIFESRTFAFGLNIIGCLLLIYYFNQLGFYKAVVIQFICIFINIYGIYNYSKNQVFRKLRLYDFLILASLILVSILIKTHIFDSYLFVLSLFSSYLLITKVPINWILWTIYDLSSAVFFYNRGEYIGAVAYIITMFLSIINYISWKKELKENVEL